MQPSMPIFADASHWLGQFSTDVIGKIKNRFPGLYEHQALGILFLRAAKRAILADQQGLGKTAQAICASVPPVLVVCPASVQLNWRREILRWAHSENVSILSSSNQNLDADWVIVNYAMLTKFHGQLLSRYFRTLILDESHYIKNPKSQRSKAVLGGFVRRDDRRVKIGGLIDNCEYCYLLSATPMNNRPIELFPQLKAIGHPLGNDWVKYVRTYCNARRRPWGWDVSGASHIAELSDQIAPSFLRRRKDQVVDLPQIIPTFIDVEVSRREEKEEQKILGAAQDEGQLLGAIGRVKQRNAMLKLPYTLELVEDLIEDPKNKVIVFSFYIDVIEQIAAHFGNRATKLLGSTSLKARQAAIDRFQTDDECQVFAANIVAGGIGINLTAANYVVMSDVTWDPTQTEQAHDRAHRIGQGRVVNVYFVQIANSEIEKKMIGLLARKSKLIHGLVGPLEQQAVELNEYVRMRLEANRK